MSESNTTYLLLAGQTVLNRQLDVETNNTANSSTTGFQSRDLIFQQFFIKENSKHHLAFPSDTASPRNQRPGNLVLTHQPLDIAIRGTGYFMIQSPQGLRYSRAGAFRDSNGILTTQDGMQVLDAEGKAITFPDDMVKATIEPDGTILSNGEEIAKLGVVNFQPDEELESVGGNLLKSNRPGRPPTPSTDFMLMQGVLEESNVNPIIQMQKVIEIQRYFTGLTEVLISRYKLMEGTLNTLAKIRA